MAKIKFNLNFGGEQIRTLDDLRDNFPIEDVLDVYNNGLLVKWLDVHNHKDELAKVNAIQTTDARGILTELIRIFGISDDPSEIQESLSVLDYLEERKKVHEDMKAHGIPDYEKVKKERDELARQIEEMKEAQETKTSDPEVHDEAPKLSKKTYEELVQEIIDHHQDLSHIYDCLDAITANYPDILKEKYSELFETLHTQRPLTLYALFAHHSTRPYYALNDKQIINKGMGHAVSDYPFFDCPYHRSFDYCLNRSLNAWKLTGHYESYVEREEAKKIPSIVFEKVRFANPLWGITKKTFDDCNGEITDIRHPFLKVFSEIPSSSYEKTQPDSYL